MNTIISTSLLKQYLRLWQYLPLNLKYNFLFLIILTVFAALSEIVNILLIGPFIAIVVQSQTSLAFYESLSLFRLVYMFKNFSPEVVFIVFFIISILISTFFRLCLIKKINNFCYMTGSFFAVQSLSNIINQPFSFHISNSPNDLLMGITSKIDKFITEVLLPLTSMITSSLMTIFILFSVFFISTVISIITFFTFAIIYILITNFFRFRLRSYSSNVNSSLGKHHLIVNESLVGIREVLLGHYQDEILSRFSNVDKLLKSSQSKIAFIASFPRFIIECVTLCLIAFIALIGLKSTNDLPGAVTLLGLMIFSVQRMLPNFHAIYNGWTMSKGNYFLINDLVRILSYKSNSYVQTTSDPKLNFSTNISFRNVSFDYEKSHKIFKSINLTIKKGTKIGIVGRSGSGKSTFLDILIGLLKPTSGSIFVDDVELKPENIALWQRKISYVPQSIFIADMTIAENVAFGLPKSKINLKRVKKAIESAQLRDFVETFPLKYNTVIGDNGIKFSGGQRQRIGIARALYKNSEILVLDEATSALDKETENSLFKSLKGTPSTLTVIFVSHRLKSFDEFDAVYEVSDHTVIRKI